MKEDDPVGWATETSGGRPTSSSDAEPSSSRPANAQEVLEQDPEDLPGAEFLAAWHAAVDDEDSDDEDNGDMDVEMEYRTLEF